MRYQSNGLWKCPKCRNCTLFTIQELRDNVSRGGAELSEYNDDRTVYCQGYDSTLLCDYFKLHENPLNAICEFLDFHTPNVNISIPHNAPGQLETIWKNIQKYDPSLLLSYLSESE